MLISKLHATGFMTDVEMFKWDEHHTAKMESQPHHSGTRRESDVLRNAFECEPLSGDTQV